jgi:hypothetical protein
VASKFKGTAIKEKNIVTLDFRDDDVGKSYVTLLYDNNVD